MLLLFLVEVGRTMGYGDFCGGYFEGLGGSSATFSITTGWGGVVLWTPPDFWVVKLGREERPTVWARISRVCSL